MTNIPLRIFCAVCSALVCFSVSARTVTDDNGDTIEIPKTVERVAVTNILPFASALTVYLNGAEKVIGMHPASYSAAENGLLGKIYPEILRADHDFMQGASVNIEALLALEPELVFVNAADKRLINTLRNAGLSTFAVSANSHHYDPLRTYSSWMNNLAEIWPEKAGKNILIEKRANDIQKLISERTAGLAEDEKAKVLFLFRYDARSIVTSGKNFFGEHWCRRTGSVNAASSVTAQNANAAVSMEQIYAWDPDIIFITNFTKAVPDDLYENKIGHNNWSFVSAVKKRRVYKMPLGIYRSYTPSADTPITLLWIASRTYPELFSDIDLKKEVIAYYKDLYNADLSDEDVSLFFNPRQEGTDGATGEIRSR